MRGKDKKENWEKPHKHEHILLFACFLASSLIGYFLMNHFALLGV